MAASALEEKINKIRQQNEEIKRRHEEVEEDKKNAAKLNALVQMVPSTDWPERKEPPEFSNPPRTTNKSKSAKEHHDSLQQYRPTNIEGKRIHTFAQGQGPPPDPKYNFLADSERETSKLNSIKENPPNRGQKYSRDIYRRKSGGKDGMQRDLFSEKDHKTNRIPHRDEHQPEYDAWRAERNRIDEDRISRQRTAEGNWRREWDNDKAHVVDEVTRSEAKLGDYARKDHKDFDRRYHINGNDYVNHNRSNNHRFYRGSSRHFHNNYENRSNNSYHRDGHIKNPLLSDSEERTVTATDQSIKVTLNQGNVSKHPVLSVKVNSPSIAGTGRVGPRQRSRVTYSSHSDVEVTSPEAEFCSRPKSFEDKSKGIYHDSLQKSPNMRKSQIQSKKNLSTNNKSSYRKKEIKREDTTESLQKHETELKSSHSRKEYKESQKSDQSSKSQKVDENNAIPLQNNIVMVHTEKEVFDVKDENKDNQNNYINACIDISEKNEIYVQLENETILQSSSLFAPKHMEMGESIVTITKTIPDQKQMIATSENEVTETNLSISFEKNMNDDANNEIESIINHDVNNDIKDTVIEDRQQTTEKTKEIINHNCDSMLYEDISTQENDVKHNTNTFVDEDETNKVIIMSSTYICSVDEKNKVESKDKALKNEETFIMKEEMSVIDENINIGNKQDVIICNDEIQKRTTDSNIEEENNVTDETIIGKLELPKEELGLEEETVSNKVFEE